MRFSRRVYLRVVVVQTEDIDLIDALAATEINREPVGQLIRGGIIPAFAIGPRATIVAVDRTGGREAATGVPVEAVATPPLAASAWFKRPVAVTNNSPLHASQICKNILQGVPKVAFLCSPSALHVLQQMVKT